MIEALHRLLIKSKKTLSIAESCTGGALTAALVHFSQASLYLLGSVVAYSNTMKKNLLGVKSTTLFQEGAVSFQAVSEMAIGIQELTGSDIALATSGIAGPLGGTEKKPIGTLFFAIKKNSLGPRVSEMHITGSRELFIQKAVSFTLEALYLALKE